MSLVSLKIVNTLKIQKSSVTVSFSPIYIPETITGLFLFQCLQSLSNNKHTNIEYKNTNITKIIKSTTKHEMH